MTVARCHARSCVTGSGTRLGFEFVEELPGVCAIELANAHGGNECGVEVAQVDAMTSSVSWMKEARPSVCREATFAVAVTARKLGSPKTLLAHSQP